MNIVPTIDLSAIEGGDDPAGLEALDSACRDHGFFLIRNHGIDKAVEDMWQASTAFFSSPRAAKLALLRTGDRPLGYYDRELTKRRRDLKEVFDYVLPRKDGSDLNQWPEDPAFRDTMIDFFDAAAAVAQRTLTQVFRALTGESVNPAVTHTHAALPPGSKRTSTVRLNYYPVIDPLDTGEQQTVASLGDMALHHHTDPGVLTLLLQDMTGGLQARSRTQGWIDVPPETGTIVVNLGDAMQVWTNDQYVAAVHRVVSRNTEPRYSTPFFFNPEPQAELVPLAPLSPDQPHYRSFTWREYIQGRVDDNYTDLGTDDIQIARFRISA